MKKIHLLTALLIGQFFSVQFLFATDNPDNLKSHFYSAKQELVNMLEGKKPLSYEQAIFLIENAYWGNTENVEYFQSVLDFHTSRILKLINKNRDYTKQNFKPTLLETEEQKKKKYENALVNKSIYDYISDTTYFFDQNNIYFHSPFRYSSFDPLGTLDWSNTQVFNLLDSKNKTGNCFALVSLFKIFSARLNSEAIICTAPGHIYIRHADHKGIYHNVELATRAFPGTGSMETLTYTTDEATKNEISLRELDLKKSVALCLIYLAKGYEYKFNAKDDNFLLECAELALQYDSLNLNAMLLKAEVLEARIISKNKSVAQLQKDKDFIEYENFITHLFSLGYREMPMEMKNLVISRLRNEDTPYPVKDHTPKPNEHLGVKNDRYFTLSGGLFDEMMLTKPIEQYHRTHFDTKKRKISQFVPIDTTYNKYPIDLVIFAWNIDPMAYKYPHMSPYAAFENNPIYFNDPTGGDAEVTITSGKDITISAKIYVYGSGATAAQAAKMQTAIMNDWNNKGQGWTHKDDATGQVYNVKFNVSVELYDKNNPTNVPSIIPDAWNPFSTNNYIELVSDPKELDVSFVRGGDEGKWRSYGTNPASHEFGHLVGLTDRYTKGKGANSGWQGNVMAESAEQGSVQQKNINAIVSPVLNEYKKSEQFKFNTGSTNIFWNYKGKIDESSPGWESSSPTSSTPEPSTTSKPRFE